MAKITRRNLLGAAMSAPFTMQMAEGASAVANFRHGVASGDPDDSSVVLWTRVSGPTQPVEVSWELAITPDFSPPIRRGKTTTGEYRDFTVKVLVEGLESGQTYFFRFHSQGTTSLTGQTKTLPRGELNQVGIALVSCSNYAFGYFTAYHAVAQDDGVDFVLHTGDYIYEYGADGWGSAVAASLGRVHTPAHETTTLADYRERHAQYKTDPGSIAMLARHPLLALWDDHESANNPWLGGAQNHQPASEGVWETRRSAAVQAYYEWMPVRDPKNQAERLKFWRRYDFGDLATLVTLESRHTGRAKQISYADHYADITGDTAAQAFQEDVLGQSGRTVLSEGMVGFLSEALADSKVRGQSWRLLGNAIPMARVNMPDIEKAGIAMPSGSAPNTADFAWKGRYGFPLYLDTWDGYPWAREQLFSLCSNLQCNDLLVLTGDSHSFWANELSDAAGNAMGLEIGTAGVTSPGDFVEQGFSVETAAILDDLLMQHNEEVRWTDNLHQGYVRLSLAANRATVDYLAVSTVLASEYSVATLRREVVDRREGSLRFV